MGIQHQLEDVETRFILGEFLIRTPPSDVTYCSFINDTTSVSGKACPENKSGDLLRKKVINNIGNTVGIKNIACVNIENLFRLFYQTCTSVSNLVKFSTKYTTQSYKVVNVYDGEWHSVVQLAISVSQITCEKFDKLTLDHWKTCSVVQDTNLQYYNDAMPYVKEPPVGLEYYRECDFQIQGASVIGSYSLDHYEAEIPLCFDHVNTLPEIDFNFNETNTTVVYDHYEPIGADRNCDFTLPYSISIDQVIKNHFHGIFHSTYCDKIDQLSKLKTKLCSLIEEACPLDLGESLWVDTPRPPIIIDPNTVNYTIETLETYCMEHLTTVTLGDLTTHIDIEGISLAETSDGFSINFSATLVDHNQKSLLLNYEKLHITINGELWIVIVEEISESEQFENKTISLKGRGITALLSEPHVEEKSLSFNNTLTVQQIADAMLPIGWSIVWEMPVWSVPSGSYSHTEKSPAKALLELAKNIGAIIVSHKSLQQITIKPRYIVKPWDFAGSLSEISIPLNIVDTITRIAPPNQIFNGVYVHGLEQGGELGFCRLNGTAGDVLAKTISNSLMTHVYGIRSLAERVLSDLSNQPEVKNFKMPFDNVIIPLVRIGQFIDVGGIKGVVNSVTVNSNFGLVTQSIQIGNKTTSNWSNFQSMLPKNPLMIGVLNSKIGESAAIVTLINGGVIRVTGTGDINGNYYIKDNIIQSKAPSLPSHVLVI